MRGVAAVFMLLAAPTLAQVAEPDDYQMEHYRSPVPDTLKGATVVGPEEAHALWESGNVAFIDVLPRAPKPEGLPEGTIWREKPRYTIPGAIWLPNVGYGAIADQTAAYFRSGLEKVTGGDTAHSVLIFCLEDCWMSWNAAKRALEWGYSEVYWLPEGTDGWAFFDYPTEVVEPEPGG
ncbi:PQQ-dependent catabolism-associated CXXCW motif protein [Vannielia litorea]|uniref:PQQ-dependent catabolism-associated CXXCW motif protein n=1 Tax=Vannielia litorea TaxID=1217970 RepID=UPI001C958737|nr:PQQ-dependent catabolism-associated CXXCW motif protein [Vannielia litorea]MBY6047220.1 PQQ-dependent catabolism-associated CXXCW motif protein [Vannielia litorea]MBY6074634.1 PQQ-dependent catabolism-associated CXXCW motif protein [Vannielia litorea]